MEQYFGINHHLNVTKGNLSLANHLSNYLMNKLQAKAGDADIDDLITFYTPFQTAWNAGFVGWRAAFNLEMGTTKNQNTLIYQLTHVKAPLWVNTVLVAYPEGTDRARALIPHKRQAFITGSAEDRITGIKTFIQVIGTDVTLTAIKTDAQTFLTQLMLSHQNHEGAREALTDCSKSQETLRKNTCEAMHAVEGSLTNKYYKTPEKVDMFFDVSAMRYHPKTVEQEGISVTFAPSEIKLLDIRFIGNEIYDFTNKGTKDVCVFFANNNNVTSIPENKFVIHASTKLQIDLSTLKADDRFVYAANMSNEDNGELNFIEVK